MCQTGRSSSLTSSAFSRGHTASPLQRSQRTPERSHVCWYWDKDVRVQETWCLPCVVICHNIWISATARSCECSLGHTGTQPLFIYSLLQRIGKGLSRGGLWSLGFWNTAPNEIKLLEGGTIWQVDSMDTNRVEAESRQKPETKEGCWISSTSELEVLHQRLGSWVKQFSLLPCTHWRVPTQIHPSKHRHLVESRALHQALPNHFFHAHPQKTSKNPSTCLLYRL